MVLLAYGVDFQSPLLWAVFIGWVLSVTLHEFGHGIVAHFGGDYTIRERGGLSLNPLQYIDPIGSLLFPAIAFMMGGIPLPGGVTFVRDDLLRGRLWRTAVSAAGPAMNFLLFLIGLTLFSPRVGWINPNADPATFTNAQLFVGAMTFLQLWSVILNLIPIPPLDGYQMIAPYLPQEWQDRLMNPSIRSLCYFGYFMLLTSAPLFGSQIMVLCGRIIDFMGGDADLIYYFFRHALLNR